MKTKLSGKFSTDHLNVKNNKMKIKKKQTKQKTNNNEAYKRKLEQMRKYNAMKHKTETLGERNARLEKMRKYINKKRLEESQIKPHTTNTMDNNMKNFMTTINTFCSETCEICTKLCYLHQISKYSVNASTPTYLPDELKCKQTLILCHRCIKHVTGTMQTPPPKAYWNNLDPGEIPEIIQNLSQIEQRLLSRIIPFLKIIKFDGLFGQYGFRGQAVLFAQDIFEVTDKLHTMLPRSTNNTSIVVVSERLENIKQTREFEVNRERVYTALQWLVKNNPLYKDVVINDEADLCHDEIIRIAEPTTTIQKPPTKGEFNSINSVARIIRASWHQGNETVFTSGYAGVQCFTMVVANILRAKILPPKNWNTNILNSNMFEGDKMYATIKNITSKNSLAYPIDISGFLEIRNLNLIKNEIHMFNKIFSIEYDENTNLYGNLQDNLVRNGVGLKLLDALRELFLQHQAGVLIAVNKSLGVMFFNNKFYYTDSHSCGLKGAAANEGKACLIECDTIEELNRICKRGTSRKNNQFILQYIDVNILRDENFEINQSTIIDEPSPVQEANQLINYGPPKNQKIQVQTSLMTSIDCHQPDVNEELEISENINQIFRKTKDNIVNEAHELKAEEFSWYYLFPYGINGLKEPMRPVRITPLDYYQYRILGKDARFQRNDYLFYALSMFEYYKVKSTIAACGKKITGQEGMVEDIHLYIKKMRGSSAYWRTAMHDLIAQIKCLGPPTYFITFSCNDLNWLDMRKALLIADGRPNEDPSNLNIMDVQHLIEIYPVIVSRHFMTRVNALMKFLHNDHVVFGGRMTDFWWRVEFQNRGSPHLHMVIWIENHPPFDTIEGIRLLDKICTCTMPDEKSELYDLVRKCQKHRHTMSCKKNNSSSGCRFGFPRSECAETHIVAHSSDDFVRSGGRICMLKRTKKDCWINNYSEKLLKLWQGNMDIQPCGSNEAIAYYIAKYISKSEPTELDKSLAQAINQIRRETTNVSQKIFKICMRIMKERQLSACESVFRLGHLNLRDSSRKCVYINTRMPNERYKVICFDDFGQSNGFYNTIFTRYEARPHESLIYNFNEMCLLEFAMLFDPYYAKKNNNEEESIDVYENTTIQTRRQFITLLDNSKMIARNIPAVVRVPYFMATSDPQHYYYSLLLQFMPYRNESELLNNFETAKLAFQAREVQLKQKNAQMNLHIARNNELERAFNQIHAFEILDQEPEQLDLEEVNETEKCMDNNEFQYAKQSMNMGQRDVFKYITRNVQDQLGGSTIKQLLFITGNAGTGKTFLFKLLKNQINRCYGKQVVKVCALTGVAARLVGGSTLHSTLKLPVQRDGIILQMPILTGVFLTHMRQQWKDVEFLFVDEISMVPYEMLCMIDARLRQIKNNDTFFGGLNILLFGDLLQLPPVRGNQVFHQPERMIPATQLWHLFSLIELTENMRQHGSTTFIDILNALRIGELKSEHFAVLIEKVNKDNKDEFSIEKALRIYPTNQQVEAHNNAVLKYFRAKGTTLHKIKAQDQIVEATRNINNIDIDNIIPTDNNKTGGLPKILEIFVGAKIMLRSNINIDKGLVNGAIGYINEIIWPNFRRAQMYETDIPTVRVDFGNDGIHLIQPRSVQFPAKYSYGTAERRMLPMVLSWASTVHKMQGSTVDNAVVYLGPKLFADGQAYVALSRVKSIDGLRIEELDCSKLTGKKPCNISALAEMSRMRNLHTLTMENN